MCGVYSPKQKPFSNIDVVIVGAGPAGLACGVELSLRGVTSLIFDKGRIVNSLFNFPTQMRFFTSRSGLEMGGLAFASLDERPRRLEALNYYQGLAQHYELCVQQQEEVLRVEGSDEAFLVHTANAIYSCRKVIIATGYYDRPNLIGIPGEDSPKVSHYYSEPQALLGQDVAIIGGRNSAATAALELHRAGVRVTLIHRGAAFTSAVKHWIRADIEACIKNGEINALFSSHVRAIHPESIAVETPNGAQTLPNDFVFALTGYKPDMDFLKMAGVALDPAGKRPLLNPASLESSRAGVYLAGVVVAGLHTHELNIEHAKDHAARIASSIAQTGMNSEQNAQAAAVD
jgi:thioredoxin reductase (NADPH)